MEENNSEDKNSEYESDPYHTPPENINEEMVDELLEEWKEDNDPINPNTAEVTDNEFENYSIFDNNSEIEEMLNNPSNGTTIDLANFLNFPDLLDINKKAIIPLQQIKKKQSRLSQNREVLP